MKTYVRGLIPYRNKDSNVSGLVLELQQPTELHRNLAYLLPGGEVKESDESLEDALRREIEEELNIVASDIKFIGEKSSPSGNIHNFFVVGKVEGDFLLNSKEVRGIGFYSPECDIPKNILHPTIQSLDDLFFRNGELKNSVTSGLVIHSKYLQVENGLEDECIDWVTQQERFKSWEQDYLQHEGGLDRR